MNKISSRNKLMFDYLIETNIIEQVSSGVYFLPPNGVKLLKKCEEIMKKSLSQYNKVYEVEFPILISEHLINGKVIDKYKEICFWTFNRSKQKYILNSDIELCENLINKFLKDGILFSRNLKFRNNYTGSISKKSLLQYRAFEIAFNKERDWENIRFWLKKLEDLLNIRLILKRIKGFPIEYNILYYGKRNIYSCEKCGKIIVNASKCCGNIKVECEKILYNIAHITFKDNIGYFGTSFELLIGAILENYQFGRWCIFPAALEIRDIIISNVKISYIQNLKVLLELNNYNIKITNKRVAEFKNIENCLVFGFDEKNEEYIVYDSFFKTITKVSKNNMNELINIYNL